MLQLIIHADDLGLSQKVNEGIALAHTQGLVTSASIIACGRAFEHAIVLAKAHPRLDMGIHLTLIEERPILSPEIIPSLVDRNGRFLKSAQVFFYRYAVGRINLNEVKAEFEAQLNRVTDRGIPISHFDSHQHLHLLPGLFDKALELSRESGIPAIRIPHEALSITRKTGLPIGIRFLQMLLLNYFYRTQRKKTPFLHSDYFVGFSKGGRINKIWLLNLIDQLPEEGTCELMCHPGLDDPHTLYGHWDYHWQDELSALLDPDVINLVKKKVILTSYRDLAKERPHG